MSTERYKKLTQREHVLLRKNMYCGNNNTQDTEMYVVDDINALEDIKIAKKTVKYNPAFVKLFDEVISNASDASIRYNNVTFIKVNVTDKEIIVENDCIGNGIPIEYNTKEKCYIPEMIFSQFLTGENYEDSDEKILAGQNGLGIKLVNVLSTNFKIEIGDGKQLYTQEFKNNLSIIKKPVITETNRNYVKVIYQPDFKQFNDLDSITSDTISIIIKRILDLSVYNTNINFFFNDKKIKVKSFKEYVQLHVGNEAQIYIDDTNDKWIYAITKSPTEQFEHVSIASSVSTYRGGTHVNYLSLNLSKAISESFSKKIKANWFDVKNKLMLFLITKISNPLFDSQTKECLTNQIPLKEVTISEGYINKIKKSDIVESILKSLDQKEKEELRKLQKSQQKLKVEKLVDANSSNRKQCKLLIFEGDSAGESARFYRNPDTQGIFKLRGKFMNIKKHTDKRILVDKKGTVTTVANLMNAIGLELGKKLDIENLRYNEINIYTDSDIDGDGITGMLINFFHNWRDLFKLNMVYRVLTPLLVLRNPKEQIVFYTQNEYDKFIKNNKYSSYETIYLKGLGSLSDELYSEIIKNPRKMLIKYDENSDSLLEKWFGNDAEERKDLLI